MAVVRVLDFKSVGTQFESHSKHYTDLFHDSPELNPVAVLANSQPICLLPVGILNSIMFHFQYLFQLFEWHACWTIAVVL